MKNWQLTDYEILLRSELGNPEKAPLEQMTCFWHSDAANQQFLSFFSQRLVPLIAKKPEVRLDLNLEPIQFKYPSTWQFLKDYSFQKNLNIEITERWKPCNPLSEMDDIIDRLSQLGYSIVFDDVNHGDYSLKVLDQWADKIQRFKVSLPRLSPMSTVVSAVDEWSQYAKKYHLELVFEEVASNELAQAVIKHSHQLVSYHQGYYWNRGQRILVKTPQFLEL